MIATDERFAELARLINEASTCTENCVIEYKVQPHSKEHDCELYKDILGLLNSYQRPSEDRWLIYGVTNRGVAVGFDRNNPDCLDDANYQQKFKKITNQPTIEFMSIPGEKILGCGYNDKLFAAFYIPAENFGSVYELAYSVEDGQPDKKTGKYTKYYRGMSFCRLGSSTEPLTEEDRQAIRQFVHQNEELEHLRHNGVANGLQATVETEISLDNVGILLVIGEWNEGNTSDRRAIEELSGIRYPDVVKSLRDPSLYAAQIFVLSKNVWSIKDRDAAAAALANRLNDHTLEELAPKLAEILSSIDGQYTLEKDKRSFSSFYHIDNGCSMTLRKGIAAFCAHISNNPEQYPNCTRYGIQEFLYDVMSPVLGAVDWKVLASAEAAFPLLAEASPSLFLSILKESLSNGAVEDLIKESGDGIMSPSLGYEIVAGIEIAAQNHEHLAAAIDLLMELAKYTDMAEKSIVKILLPWLPQTDAGVGIREGIGKSLAKSTSDAAWKALVDLLPGKTTVSDEPLRTKYLKKPKLPQKVMVAEMWEISRSYCMSALEGCSGNAVRAADLMKEIHSYKDADLITEFSQSMSETCALFNDKQRYEVWKNLEDYLCLYKGYPDADWLPKPDQIQKLEGLAEAIQPGDTYYRALYYLSTEDYSLVSSKEDYDKQSEALLQRRSGLIAPMVANKGIQVVDALLADGARPSLVGSALGESGVDDEALFLKRNMSGDITAADDQVATSYIARRYYRKGWDWIDSLALTDWTAENVGELYAVLPCVQDTWSRVEKCGEESRSSYWRMARSYYSSASVSDLNHYVKMKLSVGQAGPALFALRAGIDKGLEPDPVMAYSALDACGNKHPGRIDSSSIDAVFTYLEKHAPDDRLAADEWKLFGLISKPRKDLYLFRCISMRPELFRDVLHCRLGLDSTGQPLDGDKKADLMIHAQRVLSSWKLSPGIDEDGDFRADLFEAWLLEVHELISDGNVSYADTVIGENLFYSQADTECLFIDPAITRFLESNQEAQNGLVNSSINSRGAVFVDPTGAPEDELSQSYERKADKAETVGYIHLGATLRRIAAHFSAEAQRFRDEE
jgi:hypothetical protein